QPPVEDEGGIAEIVVTAQKRAENSQDVPISIAAVSGDMVADLHASTLQGLQGTVPNIQIGNFSNTPNTAVFTIRGIGVIEPDPYAGNTVGIVVDGVPQYFSMGALVDLYDIDRIEILRGPQGTLFGANTTGGVVNVINNAPTNQLEGKFNASFGNYDHLTVGAVANVPLGDGLAFRLAAQNDRRDGFVTNVVDGRDMGKRDVNLIRGTLRAESGNLTALLTGEYVGSRNGSPIVVAGNLPGEAEFVPPGFRNMYVSPCLPAGSRCEAPDKYLSARDGGPLGDTPDQSDMNNYRGSLQLALEDTGVGDITSITGYRQFDLFEFTDQDGSPVFLIDTRRGTKGWQFSQELRTDFSLGDRIDVTMGGFYMKTHYDHYQDLRIDFAGGATYDLATQTVTKGLTGLFQKNVQDQDNHSLSGFVQSYFQVTDALRLQAGIRYSYEKTSMLASTATSLASSGISTFDGTNPDGTPNISLGTVAPPRGRESWNNVGWKLGADYKATEDILLYGYWARGFKSGGFTGRIGIAQDLGPYDPEHVDTYEIGMKADLLDRRLRINLAAFQTDYDDIQLAQIYFVGSGATLTQGNTILNAASSRIRGFEAEVTVAPMDGLTLTGALAYLDAEYREFDFLQPSGAIVDLSGERLQNAPDWSGSAGFSYEFQLSGNLGARLAANYSYTSEKLLTSILDVPRARVQPQHLVNANFEIEVNEELTVGLWATNLFDNRYINSVFDSPGTLGLTNYAPPRQYGVSLSAEF
ncbi:MAG: TonB-dependent receptor, partial [Thermomicrobiales bacterium]